MPLLECKNLTLGYEGQAIVKNLNFSVDPGDYLCVLGENGSGKSTLVKTVLGLKHPIEGEIIFGDGLLRNQIGYLPQQTEAQRDFPASVFEIVLSGCQGRPGSRFFYSKADKARAKESLEKMQITDLSGKCYRELSGGQQQRVLLARALCAAEKLLLLDEPISGLDPHAGEELYRIIRELNSRDGMTVIMISHDIPSAIKYADHILHIGKHIFFGTTEEYLSDQAGGYFLSQKEEQND